MRKRRSGTWTGAPARAGTRATNLVSLAAAVFLAGSAAASAQTADPGARAIVDRAIDLMGGEPALRGVARVRLDMMTQWQRTDFRDVPWRDRPSFEPHVDVRDYTIPAWRNTRDFGARNLTNVVRDSVAITRFTDAFQPQSVAYVDEREELFAYTPDRLMLLLRDAEDLRAEGDTLIGGEAHRQVAATLDGRFPATVAFHSGTGLPTVLRFRAGHPNDFGLVPFGKMIVEVWYSGWRTFGEVSIPTQWDVLRVGRPYKRMTVRGATFNPDFAADSFAVPDDLRAAFLEARAPMHDRAVDSATVVRPGLVAVHGFGFPAGAVQVGSAWLLLEAGHTPLNLERGRAALAEAGVGRVEAALVVAARPGNAGVIALVDEGVDTYTSAAGRPFVDVMLANAEPPRRGHGVTAVDRERTLELGGDRVHLAPVDLPDIPGSLLLWAPRLKWLWAPDAVQPLDVRMALDRARALGWSVEAIGTPRGLWSDVPR